MSYDPWWSGGTGQYGGTMKKFAEYIPVRFRQVIYTVLGSIVALEAIFDVIPAGAEAKILQALVVLGFGVALGNTTTSTEEA